MVLVLAVCAPLSKLSRGTRTPNLMNVGPLLGLLDWMLMETEVPAANLVLC